MAVRKTVLCAILTISSVLVILPVASRPGLTGGDPAMAIERDFQKGHLSLDEKVLLQIAAIKDPARLPPTYQLLDPRTARYESRGPTMILRDAVMYWSDLDRTTRDAFRDAFARQPTAYSFVSASGFFRLHYDLTGTHQVPAADTDFSGVPDFVEKCAAYCDTTLSVHLAWGFLPPPSDGGLGGDTLFDVYFESMGYYGYSLAEAPGPRPWNDYYSYMVLNNDFLGFPPNNDPEGDQWGAAKATVAHEFHHCVQFGYDYGEGIWFMELDATCWEDLVFDQTDDNYNYLPDFFDAPEVSLLENSNHAYSCFIWGLYLSQKFDTSLLLAIWEGARYKSVFNTVSDTLQGRYGWTQDSAFADFVVWNYCTSLRDDGLHHQEAAAYPDAAIGRSHSVFPVNLVISPRNPAGYASCYIEFYPGSYMGTLQITFDGADSAQWDVCLDKSTDTHQHQFEWLNLDLPDNYVQIEVPEFESYYRVTLVAVNVSEFSSYAPFYYSAKVKLPYAVASTVLTGDSSVYSGGQRFFEYQVFNTSPLHDVFDVSFWDDRGWITPDTIGKAIPSGQDSVFAVPVRPPQGTPLQSQSTLVFAVRSRGDTTVVDTQTAAAWTVLQRGDADFSGDINVADVTYMVAYLFGYGPAPVPELLAGDFDCLNDANVADLTGMVAYLFLGGSPPPCNPY